MLAFLLVVMALGSSNVIVGRGKILEGSCSRNPDYKQVQGKKQSENKKSGNAFN